MILSKMKETMSFTFSDQGENHPGMELVGKMVPIGQGFTYPDLLQIQEKFNLIECNTELHHLNSLLQEVEDDIPIQVEDAYVLVIRQPLVKLLADTGKTSKDLYQEMTQFEWDSKYFDTRRGKVLNKHARHNVCFGEVGQTANYPEKLGTIIPYHQVPILDMIRKKLPELIGPKGENLICEGNRYYDLKKCGIGWHGDKERRKVVALRLGCEMTLNYKWFHKHNSLGEMLEINLSEGDMYIMSEKAVGTDWSCSSKYTLRHSAGPPNSKYTKITR